MKEMFDATILLLADKMHNWFEGMVLNLPNLLMAVLIIIFFSYLARWVHKLVKHGLTKVTHNTVISGLTASVVHVIVVGVGLFVSLEILHLSKVVTSLLAGAGIVGLALGIAFQDYVSNIISGIYFAVKKPLHVGDVIETSGGIFGIVKEMGLRSTVVEITKGQYVYIPNRELFQTPLTNYSQKKKRRVDVRVGIAYNSDLEKVRDLTIKTIEKLPGRIEEDGIDFFYEVFGDSSINFVVRFWIPFKRQKEYRHHTSEAIIAIKKAFDKHNINIPFPIRTLDFGGKEVSVKSTK